MSASDEEALERAARAARPAQDDPAARLVRARLKERLLGRKSAPVRLGRFVILELAGSGAMGMVYAAYDPLLDRKVALKVLERGLSEARSLAKLQHPNVVSVYEAGEVEGSSYIAMEFVQGQTLKGWLKQTRGPKEVLAALTKAARGLSAAHAAGVVHCDVKPENILISGAEVKVADFGVARAQTEEGEKGPSGGTPAYMAPERLGGAGPSFASDQFSFCVTAYEALTGRRPFEGETQAALKASIERGAPALHRARERALDRRVWAVIKRGLHHEPAARYPSMEALTAALEASQGKLRFRLFALGLLLLLVLFAALHQRERARPDPCGGGGAAFAEALPEAAQRSMIARLSAQGAGYGPAAAARIERALAEYRTGWQRQHREVCEATRVTGLQSDSAHDRKMACLSRQLLATRALLEALEGADQRALPKGVEAFAGLELQLGACARGALVHPGDPDIQRLIDRSHAHYKLGQYKEALALGAEAVQATKAAGAQEGLRAEALMALGVAQGRTRTATLAEATMQDALRHAALAQDDRLIAQIWTWLLRSALFLGRYAEVIERAPLAESVALRAKLPTGDIEGIVGEALLQSGAPRRAAQKLRQAIEEAAKGPVDRLAIMYTNLGAARLVLGDYAGADADFQRALEMMQAHLGPGHPGLGFYLEKLGRSRLALGKLEAAQEACARALAIRVEAYGPDDRAVATSALCLAEIQLERGQLEEAKQNLLRARQIRVAVYGEAHPSLVQLHLDQGALELARGRFSKASASLEAAVRLQRAVSGAHPALALALARLARAKANQGLEREAARLLSEAELVARALGDGPVALEVLLEQVSLAKGLRREVLRARAEALCARLGLPERSPLALRCAQHGLPALDQRASEGGQGP